MKNTNILYWVITIIFAGFMIFTAVPNAINEPESVKFITDLGYPAYFVPFIGIAKILGSIVLLIPGLRRIKEWAYAGLFFDLSAAVYSIAKVYGINPQITFIILPIVFLFASYFLWHKKIGTNS